MRTTVLHQCAWCTRVIDGERQGELFFVYAAGILQLHRLEEHSHVCCPHCEVRQRGLWKRTRTRTRTRVRDVLPFKGDTVYVTFSE